MIYLIGGAPRCGKTILAKKISIKQKISWLTTDAIRPVVLSYIPKSQIRNKFPYETLKVTKNEYHFEQYSSKQLLKAEITEAKSIWPGVKALIEQLINCRQNYIIEGVHLLPQFINQFRKTKYWKNIKVIYLIKKDLDRISQDLVKNKEEFDWLLKGIQNRENLNKAAKMVQIIGLYFEKQAKKYGFKIINTDTNFIKKINQYSKSP